MTVKVLADLMSQPARALVIFCRASGIAHEHVPIRITAGDTKTEEYTKLNPLQKVPVIQDGDFALTESVAIVRYLAREKAIADHWYPKDSKAQAKVDEFLEWQHLGTRAMCASYFLSRWLIPMSKRQAPNEKSVAKALKDMEICLGQVEKVWLQGGKKKYIAGDQISVADIMACCEMEQPAMAGYDVREGRTILADYMDRVKADLNPHYDDVHQTVYKMRDKFGGTIPGIYPKPE